MSLWVDKHRPNNLNKLDYHKDQAQHLKKLVINIRLISYPIYVRITVNRNYIHFL